LAGAVLVGKIKETLQSSVQASDDSCVQVGFDIASSSFDNLLAAAPMRQSMELTSAQLLASPCLLGALDKIGLGQSGGLLLPAARSVKERFETSFSSNSLELDVILGATWGIGAQGEAVVRYEVEADAPGRITPESRVAFEQFLASMEDAGLGAHDVDPTSFESFGFAEQRYKSAK
jgi:hypothetical protein